MKIDIKSSGAFYLVTVVTETSQLQFSIVKDAPPPIALSCESEVWALLLELAFANLQLKGNPQAVPPPLGSN